MKTQESIKKISIYFNQPNVSKKTVVIFLSKSLTEEIQGDKLVFEIVNDNLRFREACQMDEKTLKITRPKNVKGNFTNQYQVGFSHRLAENFIGHWSVEKEGDFFWLDEKIEI